MSGIDTVFLRPFTGADQDGCKELILAGLEEHWGSLDLSLNPDLNDIGASFAAGCFLTAWMGNVLAGTGGLLPAGAGCVQIARMSVRKELRGQGLGGRILAALEEEARFRGARWVILETTETWAEVVRFYLSRGYRVTHRLDGDVYFEKQF